MAFDWKQDSRQIADMTREEIAGYTPSAENMFEPEFLEEIREQEAKQKGSLT